MSAPELSVVVASVNGMPYLGDYLGALDELVAVAVVAVGVGVDDCGDRRRMRVLFEAIEHAAREPEIEQRVDEH